MEVIKEDEIRILETNCYKTSFNKQDVSKMKSFIDWKKMKQREGKKIVKCPICWSYEVNENIIMIIFLKLAHAVEISGAVLYVVD